MEKEGAVGELQDIIQNNGAFYLVDFKGLKVKEITELRDRVRDSQSSLKVVKNTLLRKASEGTDLSKADAWMDGPTAVAWSSGDPVALAKVLVTYSEENAKLTVKGGVVDGEALDPVKVIAFSKLPSLPEIRSQLAGLVLAPAQKLATLLQTPARQLASCLKQKGEQE